MIVTVVLNPVESDQQEMAFRIADQLDPILRQAKGFVQVTWIYNEETGEYGAVTIWQSAEDAAAARADLGPRIQEIWSQAGYAPRRDPPPPKSFTVYEPRR